MLGERWRVWWTQVPSLSSRAVLVMLAADLRPVGDLKLEYRCADDALLSEPTKKNALIRFGCTHTTLRWVAGWEGKKERERRKKERKRKKKNAQRC